MDDRNAWLAQVFPQLADTLVDDFDIVDFLAMLAEQTADLLDVAEVGLVLVDGRGPLRVMASSTERMHDIELFELQSEEGPCLDCVRTGEQILNVDLDTADERWPRFSPRARAVGYHTVHALPMRLRDQRIGAMNIFDERHRALEPVDVSLVRAFADVATIGILQERAQRRSAEIAEDLQHALNSRIAIEQAKGAVGEQLGVGSDEAFGLMRAYARRENRRLLDVAIDITHHRLHGSALPVAASRPDLPPLRGPI